MYEFVRAESKDAPDIKETMAKANIKVMQKFVEMVKIEFSGEQ